jgi:hypothetical protein
MEEYIEDDHTIYKAFKDQLFEGYAAVKPPVPKIKPWLAYVGPKILLDDWEEALAFFLWSNEDTKSETQVRFYLNQRAGLWKIWAFPQEYNTGMSSKEIEERCDGEREKIGLDKDWIIGGTAHHHCSGSAYQSGTDATNERSQNGIHITVGNLDKLTLSIDGRVSFKGTFYDCDWSHWFDMPPGLEGLPMSFEKEVMKYFLTQLPPKSLGFPKEWKANCIKKVYVPTYPKVGGGPGGWYGCGWGGASDGEVEADANAGKKPLSRKERKVLTKALGKRLAKSYDKEDLAILNEAAKQINILTASKGISLRDLVEWTRIQPTMLDADKNSAVDEFDEILHKTGADLAAVVDWIETMTATESSA